MILASSPRRASEEPRSSTALNRLVEALFLPWSVSMSSDAPYWRPPTPRGQYGRSVGLMVSKPVWGIFIAAGGHPSLNIPAAYSQCSSAARPSQTCHTGSERSASLDPASRTCGPRSAATTKHSPACTADVPPAAVRAQTHLTPLL